MQAKVILENGKVKSEYNVLFTFENENDETIIAVSYTHLTLPTNSLV